MTLVIDASAAIRLMLHPEGITASRWLGSHGPLLTTTHFDVECLAAVRAMWLRGTFTEESCIMLSRLVPELPIERAHITQLIPRIIDLRHNVTAYDAAYIALAEAMDADLITENQRLRSVPGTHCRVLEADWLLSNKAAKDDG